VFIVVSFVMTQSGNFWIQPPITYVTEKALLNTLRNKRIISNWQRAIKVTNEQAYHSEIYVTWYTCLLPLGSM